ncbi:hypothetical protein NCCP691_13430 [Noviherbaspirillum aridicola]|uniref:Uncharacterized protein n=1 Tax=Noviherbaspirillum aridicola TaxID=2849687 RepID=A0ABQ4Q2G3_9BURK|nr:hypothetical protein NCCP691_13430 [Noviherbaspirillum aridicola]
MAGMFVFFFALREAEPAGTPALPGWWLCGVSSLGFVVFARAGLCKDSGAGLRAGLAEVVRLTGLVNAGEVCVFLRTEGG